MAKDIKAFERRLSRVRRRWKAAAVFDGTLLVATEALGLFLLFMLADAIYGFRGEVRLGMLVAGVIVLAVFLVRRVVRPVLLRIPDEQIALYIEERSPKAEGSVISALECQHEHREGLSRLIAGLLVSDAVRRIDQTNVRALSHLGRLKRRAIVILVLIAALAAVSFGFPEQTRLRGERIIAPWESIIESQMAAAVREKARVARLHELSRPIEIDVQPKGMTILRGKGIEFTATLSRKPATEPIFHYQFAGADGKEHVVAMVGDQARFGYKLPFPDINESLKYYVTVRGQASPKYEIKVHDPLAVRGIELTYHYPEYLHRDPQSRYGVNGDVTVLAGTRVDVRVIANNPLKSGTLRFDGGATVAMKVGAKPEEGATGTFAVDKDGSYTYEVTDVYGETRKLEDFFFVKAVPDKPPTIKMASPKVDMSVHPLCEVTFAAKVTDDFAIKEAVARLTYYRGGKPQEMPLQMTPPGRGDLKNFLSGRVEHVLELEKLVPAAKVGDMIFYYTEITDRKGQSVKTDLFFVKLMPLEVAAAWPAEVSPPDLPHWDYLWTPDIILLAAAAWHIEQQRGKIPDHDFQAKCTQLAGRMEPAMNSQNGLNLLGGKQELPKHILAAAGDILAKANEKLTKALELLRGYEPGKAALEMQQAMAIAEGLNIEKALQEIEMAQTPVHTGQPSGGYNQDAVMEQAEFRLPGVMSDSLTAFQQEDNPRHFLPPDYRRALRLKERTAPLTKELKLAGEIYASQEQLLEMAREQFGHRLLREAAEMSCTNDPAAGQGTKGQMIRVDKRAVPYASMDPDAEMPQAGNRGRMKRPKVDKTKGLKYAKLGNNQRAGPSNPHRSQTPGGATSSDDEQPDRDPTAKKRKSFYDDQWKVVANDRRPRMNQGGGGGGGEQQQRSQPGRQQQQQSSGGGSSAQALAQRQAALAGQAGRLARSLSQDTEPGDTMARRAAGALREASRGMKQAATSFQRGDLKAGIAQARSAQQAMRSAMHGMQAAQYGTLGEALAAAQQGASALTQNQYRVSRGTKRLAERIRELSGERPQPTPGARQPGAGQPGAGQPGAGQPGAGQPGKGQPGTGQPGKGEPGKGQPGTGQPGKGEPSKGQSGTGQPGKGEPNKGQPGTGQPGKGEPSKGQPGTGQPGKGEPGKGQPGTGQPGKSEPGTGQPGKGEPGRGQPGKGEPGRGQPSTGQPSTGQPGRGQPVAGPSPGAIAKAKGQAPRVGTRMQGLAGEQLKLSHSLKDFEAYVNDLTAWSKEVRKDRVTTSLTDVTAGLRQGDVAQKMVDAGVDLSQEDLGSAQAAQQDIEAALDDMTARLREANDMLAGSKTGILSRTARQAKDLGTQVRRLAGLPARGARGGAPSPAGAQPPGQGQPSQGQGGQGQTATGQPSQGQPGRGRPGKPEDSLAQRLADQQRGRTGASTTAGRPGPGSNVPGGLGARRDEIDDLWVKARDLAETLRDEELADGATLDYIGRRVKDPKTFRTMFEKVKKAEAGKFSDVVTGVGKSLDEVLKETLSAKKLHSEQREECPPKYRAFVDAYFEALSKAATGKAMN